MISTYLHKILFTKHRKLIQRNFNPKLFSDSDIHRSFEKNGYVHLKNAISLSQINELLQLYAEIKMQPSFEVTDYYINSISFKDTALRKYIIDNTFRIIHPALPKFMDTEKASFPFGGSFCINPPNSIVGCRPHQDPTTVDELETYAMTIWISMNDMNAENGCMHVIPGSHLWGNTHRSVSIKWAFNEFINTLHEFSIPVETNVGDIICFDASTIHHSTMNQTNEVRLAVNIPVLPKAYPIRNYYPEKESFLSKKVGIYAIDEDYFIKESQYEKPSEKYPKTDTIELNNYYSYQNIKELIEEHKRSESV